MTPAEAVAIVQRKLGVEPVVDGQLVTVRVDRDTWPTLARIAREELGCLYFNWLSAIDWKAEGLEVVCRVENLGAHLTVMMRSKLGAGETRCATVTTVWKGAEWMERECYDMFGVVFDGHPDLRRILLGQDWVGHPLRKDYVDSGFTPYR